MSTRIRENSAADYVSGETLVRLASGGSACDGTMNIEAAYRRLHVPLREPVVGRTKRGEEFRGPCDVCGSTRSIVWIRGRCNACNQWLRKFLDPKRGTRGLGLGVDNRVHAARLLDVITGGIRPTFTITLDNGHTLTELTVDGGGDEDASTRAYQNTQDDYDYSLGPGDAAD